jgi:hypothetical protein
MLRRFDVVVKARCTLCRGTLAGDGLDSVNKRAWKMWALDHGSFVPAFNDTRPQGIWKALIILPLHWHGDESAVPFSKTAGSVAVYKELLWR